MTKKEVSVAVVGATGAVGKVFLNIIEKNGFPLRNLKLFSSPRSLDKEISFKNKTYRCEVLSPSCFEKIDLTFFDASDEVSTEWALSAAKAGSWVIDNSAVYRLHPEVPLVVPEVNGQLVDSILQKAKISKNSLNRIFSGPNCTTVQLVLPLKAIFNNCGLKRVSVSTYQSVSGAGTRAVDELLMTTQEQDSVHKKSEIFPHPIAYNCIPQIGRLKENGFTSEEVKIMQETKKILDLPQLKITASAVRVPTLVGHGEMVQVETETPFEMDQIKKSLSQFPGIRVLDHLEESIYPMPRQAAGFDEVFVGRLRRDPSCENGLQFWVVSDNLRKGAALNGIQIAEQMLKSPYFF